MHNEQLNRFTAQRYGYEKVLGWRERAVALRDKLEEDSQAYKRFARRNKAGDPTVMELLEWQHSESE